MHRFTLYFFSLVFSLSFYFAGEGSGWARNIALVIGNDDYAHVVPLRKAVRDAQAIGDQLEKLGFVVRRADNVSQRAMSEALMGFSEDIGPGDRVFFFYAGHGFEIDGTNYLLPTDVPAAEAGQQSLIRDASFPVARIIDDIRRRGAGVAVLVLDACRNNPFANDMSRTATLTRGLARVDAPEGVFVLMSAGAKQAALDRLSNADDNPNSVFTRAFLAELAKPGQTLVEIAKKTQIDVRALAAAVGHEQTPAYYDQVIGDVILSGGSDGDGKSGPNKATAETRPANVSVPTEINTTGTTYVGPNVKLGPGVKIGPGVRIGGKDARIALEEAANGPATDPAKAAIINQGGAAGGQKLAFVKPDTFPGQKLQPATVAPIAGFSRSNASWMVTISLPEPATAIFYRIGESGEFKQTGLLDVLDQRIGARMPNPSFAMSGRTPAGVIQVRYRNVEGKELGPFSIRFDPDVALYEAQRRILEQQPNWVEFRSFKGLLVYFTTLLSYRCAISELRYGLDDGEPFTRFDMPPCNMNNPTSIPNDATIYLKVPPETSSIRLRITWRDGTLSDVNTIERD